ncbi:adenylyltransferase/cytidyltransferase family protein [Thioalkalivibrio sp. ALJ1]|uniref:adenylyltransferase/cytidyltransferase family protein n=1 Tax=Thioalkalivibrio sp. ALJ1 TaxID=1158144 RepID=UPI00037B4945|nr:adenylyltransferase/cytidyltransferase family protein [Thioalkalivibrio sp. ALJ1]
MRIIYSKIVGDLFHHGHARFFEQAREYGDRLVVHVVDDARVTDFKRRPVMTQEERIAVISSCRWVDEARAHGPFYITREFLDAEGFAAYAFSYCDEAELGVKRSQCPDLPPERVVPCRYTDGISTTELIQRVLERREEYARKK